ncbi:MAG: serine/threonine protein kinase, partial [Acidobacteria bacterium]|nr:serine/threonine protein kinase [Acidobacteriota bacterium]
MKESAWRRLEAVVLPALDLEESERRAFLHGRCTGDPTLLRQAESFLAILEGSGGAFLEGSSWSPLLPPAGAETPDPGQLEAGRHIGPYRIEKLLGSGGMGSVYLAERADDTFAKRVALKVVRPGRRSPEAEERFRLERRLLARLEHPNIARLHDAGQTEEGLSYFVMEYVEGRPIDRFAEDEGLGLEARLRLILKVCAAVQVAHRNLVLHRDLKPANILVDGAGEPKLLDFGIGKLLPGEALGEAASLTATAQRPLTPLYASPEQVGGGAVTTATDVYGLGLLLYEVLT